VHSAWKWLTIKYSHSTTFSAGWATVRQHQNDAKGSGYLELNAAYDLGDGWGVSGHIGHQKVKGVNAGAASYTDYKTGTSA
jgi:hypothetical protein